MKSVLYVEHDNRQIDEKTMLDTAKKIWTESGRKVKDIVSLDVYANANESKVYFVFNAGTDTEFKGDFGF